ncbi:MAG: AAA domain-containing protein [bacterium]|nr:AAA domain-containing protein [bacterium]
MSDNASVMPPSELAPAVEVATKILDQLDTILLGRPGLHRMVLAGILSRGHILLEGLPGTGKTALVKAIGDLMGLKFRRVQFTPDLMPSDILGTHILQDTPEGKKEMVFQEGPIFTNILLADEINRASPKTQSALLEAMQECSVTLMGQTRPVGDPFFVLASQNPIELEGTYPLPEAQLDRFLFKLQVDPADTEAMEQIITTRRRGCPPEPTWRADNGQLDTLLDAMERMYLPHGVAKYISRLVTATHPNGQEAPEEITKYVSYGASPRAAIAIGEASRALALISGRPTVGFDDVREVACAVLNHRMLLNYQGRFDQVQTSSLIANLLDSMDEAGLNLPGGISVTEEAGE